MAVRTPLILYWSQMASTRVPRHFFTQSAVLAWREGRILLVSTANGNWTIPKGVVEQHLTPAQSAAQEAYEEGGIRGAVREPSIGWFEYEKWGGLCRVEVFEMDVKEVLDQWPENNVRERQWTTLEEAASRVHSKPLAELLKARLKS
jgi:8-oxo-dGTP pyrophosphatase MutT (NUDIX family)